MADDLIRTIPDEGEVRCDCVGVSDVGGQYGVQEGGIIRGGERSSCAWTE